MYKYEFELKQITPMIHFQHDESGATLRSTEVKPKLDKFLWYCIQEKNYLDDIKELVDALEEEYKANDNSKQRTLLQQGKKDLPESLKDAQESEKVAFRYRLRIKASGTVDKKSTTIKAEKDTIDGLGGRDQNGNVKRVRPVIPINSMYFGNMVNSKGMKREQKKILVEKNFKESLLYDGTINCVVTADSFELLALIKTILPAFFLLHNFGTRQTKGFGGFEFDGKYNTLLLITKYGKYDFLCIERNSALNFSSAEVKMDIAKWIYALMKGGINFNGIYEKGFAPIYFLKQHIGNEKAFMKRGILRISATRQEGNENKIVPTPHSGKLKCKYVRALLGTTESYAFKKQEYSQFMPEETVSVWSSKNQLGGAVERYASPILIKITNDYLYFIPTDDGEAIMGKKFYFSKNGVDSAAENDPNFPHLLVPDVSALSSLNGKVFIEDFLKKFHEHFNEVKKKNIYNGANHNAEKNGKNTKQSKKKSRNDSFSDVCKSQMHYVEVRKKETSK